MKRLLPLLVLVGAVVLAACPKEQAVTPPPAGLAGGGTATPGAPPNSRGAGFNPSAGAPSSQPAVVAQPTNQRPGNAPAFGNNGQIAAGSQPAAGGRGRVIKGAGSPNPPPKTGGHVINGTVEETMNAASYTYMRVKVADGNDIWFAVGASKVEVGQKVSVEESITMADFHSKALNRTFASIVFGILK